ncbi:MAG: AHH domain-containing protein, partial [Anaerolineae bacterium]|nr:AHH domain-containing protein [Anaerolineae bacterium]
RARWYDPDTGRFLTQDPFPGLAALPTTQHPYVYVGNNPVNLTDPSGEIAPILVAAGIGAAIGGVGGGVSYVLVHPGGRPEDYLRSGGFWRSVGVGAAGGAVAGAVGWAVPALLPAGGSLGYAVGLGALSGSLTAGAGQVTVNLLTPCTPWHSGLVWAMAAGGVSGSIAGGVGYGVRQWRFRGLPRQLHHYATNKSKVYTPQYERILQRYGLSLDDAWNTELLPHQGRHPNEYHDFVLANMQRAANEAGDDVNRFLQLFERYVVRPIRNNPDLLRRSGWR